MAGYVTKLMGHVYDGANLSGEPLTNGVFENVLTELGYKLNFEAIANYAGNAFCDKSWDMIEKSNPFRLNPDGRRTQAMNNLAGFFGKSKITILGGA